MEEEKAAAYYDELSRKGGGAARFKQGLGFSASGSAATSSVPERGSALPSSSSFLSNFVRASSPTQASKFEKQAQLQSVQNKLKKKPDEKVSRASERSGRESTHRHRSRSRERDRDRERYSRKRSRSRDRDIDRDGGRERDRDRRRRRSRSASPRRDMRSERSRDRSMSPRERRSERSRGRSVSPRERRRTESSGGGERKLAKNRNVDYTRLIEGYDKMTPAERVKAKMKLQLAETAEKDEIKVSGWERFEFDKDAPLDDKEIEAAEDDVALVKRIGQSFRFSAVEARREDQVRDAHDAAMFGVPVRPMSTTTSSDSEAEVQPNKKEENESDPVTNLISEKVLAKQQGSWRDRARKV